MNAQEMFDWGSLLTTTGATAAVLLIVQYLKVPLDRVWKIPTRAFVLALSLGIMLAAKVFSTGLAWQDAPLLALNAFVVALAAMGAYENTFKKREGGDGPKN
ncbi:hypothetical protein ACH6CV_02625 [Bacillota bacterium Meth-B3]|nr:hypothetical protein [Christensenellaceae bacterium]MEA5066173.1 hypothetical protein [Eubacteriales bacterium]